MRALPELARLKRENDIVSDYRAWKRGGTADRQGLTDGQRLVLLQSIQAEVKGAYGSPRMVRERRARGFRVSQPRG